MNTPIKKLISSLATGLLLLAMIPTPAFTQTATIQHQAPAVTPPADLVKIIKRPARPFKPFEMREAKTGKPIPPNSEITLPNGKRMTAQQYFEQLNQYEKKLNEMGYSLRDPQEKTKIQESNINKTALQQQASAIAARPKSNSGQPAPAGIQDAQKEVAAQSKTEAIRMAALQSALTNVTKAPTKVHTEKAWNYSLGNPSRLSAYFKAKLVLDGTKDVTNVSAEADAGGSVFNYTKSLLRATANINAPKTGTMNAKLDVYVLGSRIYNLDQTVNANWSKSDSIYKTLDLHTPSLRFPIGPISISAKVGVQGSSGVAYFINLKPLSATAWLLPKVNAKAYAQVGIDIGIAGAGVRGNLTFLNYQLFLTGQCSIIVDAGKLYFFEKYFGSEQIECLQGNLELYAFIYYPCFDWPPVCKKEYSWDLWSWNGFTRYDTLFNQTRKTYLIGAAPARVEP
jgi:hypothetical protein